MDSKLGYLLTLNGERTYSGSRTKLREAPLHALFKHELLSRMRNGCGARTPVDHDHVDVFVARPEQHIAPVSLLRRAVSQEPREQLIAQPR